MKTLFPHDQPEKKKRTRKQDPLWDAMVKIWPQYKTSQLRGQCQKMHQAFRELGVQPYELIVYAKMYQNKCGDYLPDANNIPSAGALINQWQNCKPGKAESLRIMFDEWMHGKPVWLKDMECAYYVFLYIEGMAKRTPQKLLNVSRRQYMAYVRIEGDAAILHTAEQLKGE